MKLFFDSRSQARSRKGSTGVVRDCKNNPHPNGQRWAVEYNAKQEKGNVKG